VCSRRARTGSVSSLYWGAEPPTPPTLRWWGWHRPSLAAASHGISWRWLLCSVVRDFSHFLVTFSGLCAGFGDRFLSSRVLLFLAFRSSWGTSVLALDPLRGWPPGNSRASTGFVDVVFGSGRALLGDCQRHCRVAGGVGPSAGGRSSWTCPVACGRASVRRAAGLPAARCLVPVTAFWPVKCGFFSCSVAWWGSSILLIIRRAGA